MATRGKASHRTNPKHDKVIVPMPSETNVQMKDEIMTVNSVPFLDLKRQHLEIKAELEGAVSKVIENCDFIGGAAVGSFENAFASFCGASHCVGLGNGTDAIQVALRACGVGPGDEVITAANTFIATSEAISAVGAKCIFVDCTDDTYLIDIDSLERAITPRTKAIIPVHLYGQLVDMATILALAEAHGIRVIEDAAQAHGAKIDGKRAGTFGDIGCFSFYPGKNLGAFGDAGAVITNDEGLADQVRLIANHGRATKHDHILEGMNSRLDTIQAAVLEIKLSHLDEWNEHRRTVARRYTNDLSALPIVLPNCPNDGSHVFHLYVVRVKNREELIEKLRNINISTGIHYPIALPNTTAYGYLQHSPEQFPNASAFESEILSLPIYPMMTDEEVLYVVDALKNLLGDNEVVK